MTTTAIIQARMGSSRLPGKVLADLGGRPVLAWVTRASAAIPGIDKVLVATTDDARDDAIADWCAENGTACFRGSEQDVLGRYAAAAVGSDIVLRITADNPLMDPQVCGEVLALLRSTGAHYACNFAPHTFPDGLDCEALTASALFDAASRATDPYDREHVTPYIRHNRSRYRVEILSCPLPGLDRLRWTLDTEDDLAFLRKVTAALPDGDGPPSYLQVLDVLNRMTPETGDAACDYRFPPAPALVSAPVANDRYQLSQALLRRATKTIPLGSQTFSKAPMQYPEGRAPSFLTHGEGGRVWDVDGNQYVDLISGLLPVVLGYRDRDVDAAIRRQLNKGISFSLATELEAELAERLVDIVPCAEMVRFGKNGSDATVGAVRIARAATGRERIAACGYHGWHDWYIGATTRNKGVPVSTGKLTHHFPYNDLGGLKSLFQQYPGEFAAVIMEPMNLTEPQPGFLQGIRDLARKEGAVLIFDEIITGFRYALGGAQAHFGVTPDLAVFGKAMGNGMPVSAVAGRADLMMEMEQVFFSSTFGGECLSLAAALAVIDKMQREPVIETLWRTGADWAEQVDQRIAALGLQDVLSLRGLAPWKLLAFNDHGSNRREAIRTLFLKEMLEAGVLVNNSHNVSYAHDEADRAVVLDAYDKALGLLAQELEMGGLEDRMPFPAIEPVMSIR